MPSNNHTSVLDDTLVYIRQRIATILTQPTNKNKNYIASLHNEVVGIHYCYECVNPS